MKKLIFSILILALCIIPVLSLAASTTVKLLNEAAATGPGSSECSYLVLQNWKCDAILTGSPTATTVRYEGSEDKSHFDPTGLATCQCSATQLAAGICSCNFCSVPTRCIRANLTVLTGGTVPTVSVYCTGAE
jgi:hypothetical protein